MTTPILPEGRELLAKAEHLFPIVTNDTPDYAELYFGTSRTQAMTLEPASFHALDDLIVWLRNNAFPLIDASEERALAAEQREARLREALEPFARLEVPRRPSGNAGAYSIFHKYIISARAALSTGDEG